MKCDGRRAHIDYVGKCWAREKGEARLMDACCLLPWSISLSTALYMTNYRKSVVNYSINYGIETI